MNLMLEFIYCDQIELDDANLALLLMALANRYQLIRLKFLCEQIILESIEPDTLAFVFVLANQVQTVIVVVTLSQHVVHKYNASELKSGCISLAKRFWSEVLESAAWLDLSQEDKELLAALCGKSVE